MDWQPHHYHQQRMWSSEPVSPSSFIYTPRGTTPATDPFHESGDEWGAGSLAKGYNGADLFSTSRTLQHPAPERPPVPRSERNYPAEAYRHHRAQQCLSPSSPRDNDGSSSFPHPHPSQQHVVAYQQQQKHQQQQASSQAFDQSSPAGYPFAAVNWQAVTDNGGPRSADYDEARAFFLGGPRTEKAGPGPEWTPPRPRMFCRRPTSPKPRIVSLPDDYEEEGKETMQQRYQQQRQRQQPSGLEGVCGRERGRESTVSAEVGWKEECDTKELEVYHQARGREAVAGYGGDGGGGGGGESERPSRLQDLARAAVTAASTPTGILGQRPDRQVPFLNIGNRVSGGAVSEQADELNRSGTRLTSQMPPPQPPQRNGWYGEAEEAVSPRTVPPSMTQQLPKPHSNPSRQGRAPPGLPQMGTFRHRPRKLAPLPLSPASPWPVRQPDVCGRQGVEDDDDDDDEMDLEEGEIARTLSCASSMTVHAPPSAVNGLPSSRRRAAAQAVHDVCLEVTRRYLQAQITNWQLRNPPQSDEGEGHTLYYHRCRYCSCCGSSPGPSGGGRRVRGQAPPRRASLVQRSSPDRHKRRRGPYPSQARGRERRGDGGQKLSKRSWRERSGAAFDPDDVDDDDNDDSGLGTSGTVTPENARNVHGPSQHRHHHYHHYRHQPASIPLQPIQLPPAAGAAIHSSRQTTTTSSSPSPSLLAHTTAICTLAWERARRVGDLDDRAEAVAVEYMSSLRRWAETVALTFRVAVEPSHQKEEEEEEEEECGPIRDGSRLGEDVDGDAHGRRDKKSQREETSRLEDEAMEDLGHVAGAGILLCQQLGDDEGVETIERLMTCRGYGFLLGGSDGASARDGTEGLGA